VLVRDFKEHAFQICPRGTHHVHSLQRQIYVPGNGAWKRLKEITEKMGGRPEGGDSNC
jgi:hypothetical protein